MSDNLFGGCDKAGETLTEVLGLQSADHQHRRHDGERRGGQPHGQRLPRRVG